MPGRDSKDPSDDEQDLINAEFDAMVSGLSLDQSSPRTYLDELDDFDALDKSEAAEIYQPPRVKRGLHGSLTHLLGSLKRWWNRPNSGDGNRDGDGAVL
jgi:hypothetical protein